MEEIDINWPDEMDYSIFDLVLLHLPDKAIDVTTNLKHKVREQLQDPKTTRFRDKIAFVLGVSLIWTCAYTMGKYPHLIAHWYGLMTFTLLTYRWFTYRKLQWHYFFFDLCYFVNFLLLIWIYIIPTSRVLYIAIYALSNGPISWAILAWRNSMVFHSIEKVTSLFIHIAPPLVLFTLRWLCGDDHERKISTIIHASYPLGEESKMEFLENIFYGILFYVMWQILYYICIVVIKGRKVESGQRMTSYSWLLDDDKNSTNPALMYRLCSGFGHQYRLLMFMFWQLIYALVTMVPTMLFYQHFWINSCFMVFLLTLSIWNGANYYFEVFTRKYNKEK